MNPKGKTWEKCSVRISSRHSNVNNMWLNRIHCQSEPLIFLPECKAIEAILTAMLAHRAWCSPNHAGTKAWWLLLLLSGYQDFIVHLILRAADLLDCLGSWFSWHWIWAGSRFAHYQSLWEKNSMLHTSRFVSIFYVFFRIAPRESRVPVSFKHLVVLVL